MKYSIVIPTTGNVDLLDPCVKSILDNTGVDALLDSELIIVKNEVPGGENWNVRAAAQMFCDLRTVTFNERIGYTMAANVGIGMARGEFIILMNDDCQVLPYGEPGRWLEMLAAPFVDPAVAVTGPKKISTPESGGHPFIVFFLAMVRRSVFDKIGVLDESFSPGGGEDIDFCWRAEKEGYRVVSVPKDIVRNEYVSEFPFYHMGEQTVHTIEGWEDGFQKRMARLVARRKKFEYSTHADVTAYVSTKGRYATTLPMCIASIANQTLPPKKFMIYQDDHETFDMRTSTAFLGLFALLDRKGIEWGVVFGPGSGQVANHHSALETAETEWLWRLDDDNVAEPDCLRRLCDCIDDRVGAIGGLVIDPRFNPNDMQSSTSIARIDDCLNYQWTVPMSGSVVPADHLYSSFLYRKVAGLHGYCRELSPVGHREETLFTHEMKLNGWGLLINPAAVTWHLREATGGIRSFDDGAMWEKDEAVFRRKLGEWNVGYRRTRWVNLDCGMGDTWVFKPVLEEMLRRYSGDSIVVATCYPAVFDDLTAPNLRLVSIATGKLQLGESGMEALNVYAYCLRTDWKDRPIREAFGKMYLT